MFVCFLDFHVEGIVRQKILFNLLWRQLNQHSSDFWCFFWSCNSNNKVINDLTNLVFQIWVLFWHSWNNFWCQKCISLWNTHLLNVLLRYHWHSVGSHWWHWSYWLWNQSWLWSLWHSLLIHMHLLIILMMWNLVLLHLVVLVILIVISILVIWSSSSSVSLVVSVCLIHLCMS